MKPCLLRWAISSLSIITLQRLACALSLALVILSAGCARHAQYRTNLIPCRTAGNEPQCQTAAIEENNSYVLGFVEFDDQGWLWSRPQLNAVLDRLIEEDAKQRLLIITFVHGWQHNAKYDDSNVEMVRRTLRALSAVERSTSQKEGRPARKIVGVYAGWRGMSYTLWGIKNFSFWERKNTAHEVGRGALCELFLRLEDIRNNSHIIHRGEKDQTRLILVGHSFGGAASYSALASILAERAVETIDEQGNGHPPRGFGDLVILVNPAFEAARYGVLQDIAVHQKYFLTNRVNLAIFTSKTDKATKVAFPLGRHVSTLFDRYKDGLERKANTTSVGHFAPFITHDLIATPGAPPPVKEKVSVPDEPGSEEIEQSSRRVVEVKRQGTQNRQAKESEDFTFHFDGSDLKPRPGKDPRMPLYVVSVDSKIIPDHNAIVRKPFLKFLEQFVLAFTPDGQP
jgi:hypothetical protein